MSDPIAPSATVNAPANNVPPPAPPAPDASNLPVTTQQPDNSVTAIQPTAPPSHSILGDVLHAVADLFAGPSTRSVVDAQGNIVKQPIPRSERIANAIATGIVGASAGAAQHGPGAIGKAGLAGAQAEEEIQQRQKENTLALSANRQRQLLNQASIAHMTQQTAASAWQMQREQTDVDEATAAKLAQYGQLVASDPRNKDWGQYATFADFLKAHEDLSAQGVNLAQMQAQGKLVAVPVTEGGKITGVRVFQIEPEWANQLNADPVEIKQPAGLDDKGNVIFKTFTIPAGGAKNGDILKYQGTTAQDSLAAQQKQAQQKLAAATAQSEITRNYAGAALSDAQAKNLQAFQNLAGSGDLFGNQIGEPGMDMKEYNKRVDAYAKDYGKDLNQLDQAAGQLNNIIANAERTGRLPGAASIVGLFDAIGISSAPLKGRGFRINNEIVGEHRGARNVWQTMATKLQKVSPNGTGQVVTLQQLKDYDAILQQARHDAYVGAADQALNQHIGVRDVPLGHNQPPGPGTVKIFLDLSDGDPEKAMKALAQAGWK